MPPNFNQMSLLKTTKFWPEIRDTNPAWWHTTLLFEANAIWSSQMTNFDPDQTTLLLFLWLRELEQIRMSHLGRQSAAQGRLEATLLPSCHLPPHFAQSMLKQPLPLTVCTLLLLPCLASCWVGEQSRQRCQPRVATHQTSCLEKCTLLHRYTSTTTTTISPPPTPPLLDHRLHFTTTTSPPQRYHSSTATTTT